MRALFFTMLAVLLCTGCASRIEAFQVAVSELPDYPTPISNNAVTSVIAEDGTWTVYSMMGIVDPAETSTITTSAFRLVQDADAWEPIAEVPGYGKSNLGKIGASAVTIRGRVYLVGGYAVVDDRTEITETRLLRYEPSENRWEHVSDVPVEVDDTLATVWRDRWLVLVSGWHGPDHDNVHNVQFYDTVEDVWVRGTPLPGPPVFGQTGGISGDTLLVADGVTRGDSFEISKRVYIGRLDAKSPGEIKWQSPTEHPGSPTYRAASNATLDHRGDIVIFGGTSRPYNITGIGYDGVPSEPLSQFLVYRPRTRAWRRDTSPSVQLMDLRGMTSIGDRWVIVGGMTAPEQAVRTVHELWR